MEKERIIEIQPINVTRAYVTIEGDSDLVLNCMNAPTERQMIDARKGKAKKLEQPDKWEVIITSIHWRDGTPTDFSEESFQNALQHNAPCITAFGLKKSFGQAVTQSGIDKYSTKFDACFNISATRGYVPVTFSEYFLDEKLMSPKRGAPVLAYLSHFIGWRATFEIACLETVYTLDSFVNIINLAGFGKGIGSGRTSGYGRYHVVDVKGG